MQFPVPCLCQNQPQLHGLDGSPRVTVGRFRGPYMPGILPTIQGLGGMDLKNPTILAYVDKQPSVAVPLQRYQRMVASFPPPPKVGACTCDGRNGGISQAWLNKAHAMGLSWAKRRHSYRCKKSSRARTYSTCYKYEGPIQAGKSKRNSDGKMWDGSNDDVISTRIINSYNEKKAAMIASSAEKRELDTARKAALAVIANPVPFQGHVITPKVEGGKLVFTVRLAFSGKTQTYPSLEKAKAAILNEVALGPGGLEAKKEFEDLAKKVGEDKAAKQIVETGKADKQTAEKIKMQAQQPPAQPAPAAPGMPPAAPEKKGMSTPVVIGIVGAAAVGALLLTRG